MTPEEIVDRWHSPLFAADGGMALYRMGVGSNLICGDSCIVYVKLSLRGHLEGGITRIVEDARHTTEACTLTTAAADILCEQMIGKPVDFKINLFELLGIPVGINRRACVLAPMIALEKALNGPEENR